MLIIQFIWKLYDEYFFDKIFFILYDTPNLMPKQAK